ncbi:hypothetical protein L3Q82_007002 [Scortum barcoo]|uniref:Uncharacterized protein n=1 Tax=Scortum barcoo TaxID=214431 RepID=A0ACB8WX98_9TELE|nr:hypothetical protein L3Q82_007002 [Scortum barcoo]
MIRKGKDCYRRKMEHQLQQNNICGVWKGLKTISGFKEPKSQPVGDQGWANDLNLFFNRFDQASAPPPGPVSSAATPITLCAPCPLLLLCPLPPHDPWPSVHTYLTLPFHTLSCALPPHQHLPAPACSSHHTRVHIQPEPEELGRVPQLWKTSCIVPVPKTPHPKELNSYRPVALTSHHLMKTLERLVLAHLRPLVVSSFMDPLQFAYQPDIGVDDACIQHHPAQAAGDKLQLAGVDHHLTTWILDYLTHRPQFVRVQGFESDRLLCSTGAAPQGTVLAPFLFTLYTADFSYNTPSCHLQKFSDDSAVVGLITDGDDREYRGLIQDFADWCLRNNLQINAGKTKELVVDFRRRSHSPPAPVSIQGTDIDTVKSYKYLGVHLNDSLDLVGETPMPLTFYDSVVASAIFYGIVCWASSITDRDRRRMDRLDSLTALGSSFSEQAAPSTLCEGEVP